MQSTHVNKKIAKSAGKWSMELSVGSQKRRESLSGKYKEEMLEARYTYFSILLGVSPVNDQVDITPKVLNDTKIYHNPFTMDEL